MVKVIVIEVIGIRRETFRPGVRRWSRWIAVKLTAEMATHHCHTGSFSCHTWSMIRKLCERKGIKCMSQCHAPRCPFLDTAAHIWQIHNDQLCLFLLCTNCDKVCKLLWFYSLCCCFAFMHSVTDKLFIRRSKHFDALSSKFHAHQQWDAAGRQIKQHQSQLMSATAQTVSVFLCIHIFQRNWSLTNLCKKLCNKSNLFHILFCSTSMETGKVKCHVPPQKSPNFSSSKIFFWVGMGWWHFTQLCCLSPSDVTNTWCKQQRNKRKVCVHSEKCQQLCLPLCNWWDLVKNAAFVMQDFVLLNGHLERFIDQVICVSQQQPWKQWIGHFDCLKWRHGCDQGCNC